MNYSEALLMAIIEIENIGKRFKHFPSHWARLGEWLSGGIFSNHSDHWALKNISFNVQAGESLGIIGQNGAGKSTLLKILTGTTQPTEGSLTTDGRVSALLELGMGFHPDFNGKENAMLACQMSGISSEKTKALMPEIESFSELGDYLNQPLRVYSTGMQMRLAFSTATAVRPDVLIVDEALSVGDAYFQHKCIRRIRSFIDDGTTLLFVSHDPGAVKSLCDRAILLDRGVLVQQGSPDSVLDYYNAMIAQKNINEAIMQVETTPGKLATRSGSGKARIRKVEILNESGQAARAFRVGETARIECRCDFLADVEDATIGVLIRDRLGNDVFGTNTHHFKIENSDYRAGDQITGAFTIQLNLGYGNYAVSVAVHSESSHLADNWDWWDNCVVFQIIPDNSVPFIGLAALPTEIDIRKDRTND
jgi:lipopolysaccharide transport system ATP-binding protein